MPGAAAVFCSLLSIHLVDDMLDFTGESEATGKPIGGDLRDWTAEGTAFSGQPVRGDTVRGSYDEAETVLDQLSTALKGASDEVKDLFDSLEFHSMWGDLEEALPSATPVSELVEVEEHRLRPTDLAG